MPLFSLTGAGKSSSIRVTAVKELNEVSFYSSDRSKREKIIGQDNRINRIVFVREKSGFKLYPVNPV